MGAVGTRILAVEDDERIRAAVKLALEDEGWTVDEAGSGEEAIELFSRTAPDVVLIDIMLPGIDGFELCRTLRRTSAVPIVMVTARADTHDVVAGLEAGADDYLVKPFVLAELVARVKALLRRRGATATFSSETIQMGPLEVDIPGRRARVNGVDVDLTKREFDLLAVLAEHKTAVLSRAQLLELVWGYDFAADTNVVDVFIGYLRRKLEAGGAPRLLHTVRGVGFVLRIQ